MNSQRSGITTGIKKRFSFRIIRNVLLVCSLTVAFVLPFVLCGCGSSSSNQNSYCQLYLDISSEKNKLFNKFDISVSLDGAEIGSIENGKEFLHSTEVMHGEHTLEFCKAGSKKPKCEKTITVAEDTVYSCKLTHSGSAIKITNESVNVIVSETTVNAVSKAHI